jgi:DNA-binding response OmpR family regulator
MTAVLVVERDPSVSFFVAEALTSDLGAEVRCVFSGEDAAYQIDTFSFDLAIIDMNLGQTSGVELARRAANKNLPTLMCSGRPDSIGRMRDCEMPHLEKPFHLDELVVRAAAVLRDAADNIRKVKESCARLQASTARQQAAAEGLLAEIGRNRKLLEKSKELLAKRIPNPWKER